MKEMILHNWQAKLVCLILATALWYLIRQNEGPTAGRFDRPAMPPAEKKQEPAPISHEPKPTKIIRN